MPDEEKNMEYLEESIDMSDSSKEKERIAHLDNQISDEIKLQKEERRLLNKESSDNVDDNPLLNILSSIDASASLFKFPLGTRVRNRHNEDGYIEMIGINIKGIIYLVNMPEGRSYWYNEQEIRKVHTGYKEDDRNEDDQDRVKTDIPQPDRNE